MSLKPKRLVVGAVILGVFGIGALFAARTAFFAFAPAQPGSQVASVLEIHKGQGPNEISRMLEAAHVIQDAGSFALVGRFSRQWGKIKAGEYRVSPGMSPLEIFGVITSGISIGHPVTIREGENMYEIAADLEHKGLVKAAHFLALARSPALMQSLGIATVDRPVPSLEGYLFPETYFFNKSLSAEDMIRQMVRHFYQAWGEPEVTRAKELGLSRHEMITLASMIEKETGAPQERPMIASVFYNRLKKHMRLQSDPTTIYGIWEKYQGNLHRSDLLTQNAYNTYAISALPIGPIGNPGRESIKAALYPVETNYLFFVSHNDGTHQFSATLAEHNSAVGRFQLDPKAREGKSWRDLGKVKAKPPKR